MTRVIPDMVMANLSAFLKREIGLVYAKEQWGELERRMAAAARRFGFDDTGDCIRWLMSAPLSRTQIETLASFLTIGETYFYRDPRMLEIAVKEILPGIVRSRRGRDQRLRIWSAGCSTGEEPYSIAILLHRMLLDISEWNVTILATDINKDALQKGMGGLYGTWSFRGTPSWFQNLYFTREPGERFRVTEPVRRMVHFQYLNLAEDSYPSLPTNTNAMDLILCRNVLMYFDRERAQTVVAKLRRALVPDGWLLLGAAESSPHGYPGYQGVSLEGVTCYRKKEQEAPALSVEAERSTPAPESAAEPAPLQPEEPEAPSATLDAALAGEGVPVETAADLYRRGMYQQAVALLTGLKGVEELAGDGLALLIRCEANLGRLTEALAHCNEALTRNKLDPALHFLRAEILQEQGMIAEAQLSLQRALYVDPTMVVAHFALGNLTLWGGKGERAQRHFENALALLDRFAPDDILPGSEGMTAGRLKEIIGSMSDGARKSGGRS